MNGRLTAVLAAVLAVLAFAYPRPADARSHDHGQTKFFTDVYIAPDEVVDGDLNVVFGNAARLYALVHGARDIVISVQLESITLERHLTRTELEEALRRAQDSWDFLARVRRDNTCEAVAR